MPDPLNLVRNPSQSHSFTVNQEGDRLLSKQKSVVHPHSHSPLVHRNYLQNLRKILSIFGTGMLLSAD